jgi:hypothetical protein
MAGRTGQAEQDRKNRTGRAGQAGQAEKKQDWQNMTESTAIEAARTDCQTRLPGSWLSGKSHLDRAARKIARTGPKG